MRDSKGSKVSCNAGTFASARAFVLLIVSALSLIALSACVTKTAAPSTVPAVSFQLLPPATIQSGGQAQLIAIVTNDPKMMGIDWNASCTGTACGSFNPTHTLSGQPTTYTAPSIAPQGGVNLAARASALPAQTAVVNVSIFTNVAIKLTGFPSSPLGAGNTTSIIAVVSGDPNNPPLGVGWSLACTVANCGSLSAPQTASGAAVVYTAPANVTTGFTVVIQATPLADPTQIISTSITVNPSSSVLVVFSPGPPGNIPAGTTVMVAATVSNDPQAGGVNWSVTCVNSAAAGQCGTFAAPPHTASGVPIAYTAPATVPAGGLPVVITAASQDVPSAVANASSNITNPALSVAITTQPPSSMPVSTTAKIIATLQNDTGNLGVTWSASCTPAAASTCGSFSPTATLSGIFTTYQAPTAIPTNPNGVVTITATTVATPVVTATAMVTITAANSVSISFTAAPPANMALGQPANISATVSNDPVTAPNGVSWAANCTEGAPGAGCGTFSVNPTQNGLQTTYTAPTVLPQGQITIVATAQAAPNPTVSQAVTILPPTLTVTITTAIPASIEAGTNTPFTATVTNDSTPPGGVNWSVTCTGGTGTNPCGSFSPVNTLSGIATTFTAPTAVPTGGTVTITATSAAQSNVSASTPAITITPNVSSGLLKGQYALNISGQNGNPFLAILGSIIADGQGGITGGEEDAAPPCGPITVPVTGTYTVGSDGRGTMTINTGANGVSCFGASGIQTLSFTIAGGPGSPAPRALVSEFDNAVGSGSLDLQDTADIGKGATSIGGNYAFVFDGFDINNTNPNTGISTTDIGGTIAVSGSSMIFAQDVNDQGTGTVTPNSQTLTFSAPDNFGRGTATSAAGVSYVFYVVNAGQIKFLENDGNNFVEIGSAYSQGTFTPGNFVFTIAGVDGSGNGGAGNGLIVAGGAFTASASALSNGIIDVNDNGTAPVLGTAFTGTITSPTNGRGTLTLTSTLVGIRMFAYYPTAKNGLLLMELDAGFATIGVALPQPASITTTNFNGNYAMNFTNATAGVAYQEEDAVGVVAADGVGAFTGTVDLLNTAGNLTFGDALLTGSTFVGAANPGQGRFTGTFVIALNASTNQTQKEIFYMADPNNVLFIEADQQAQTSGIMLKQNLTP
jgi:hypothetical protein